MEANKILKADLLDILFENRNKAYGAYELRVTYPERVKKSMIAMAAVSLVFITGVLLANSKSKDAKESMHVIDLTLTDLKEKEKPPIVEQPKPKPVQVKTLAVTIPKIVPDKELDKTEVPPEDVIDHSQISNISQEGADPGDIVAPPLDQSTSKGIEIKNDEPDYSKEFHSVQTEAQFPGGFNAWTRYLQRNLNTEIPVENGAPAGTYKVVVSFLVDRDGKISEIKALNDPGYGTAQEAIRVINKSVQWIPALQNGRNVIYRQSQAITFVVNEG